VIYVHFFLLKYNIFLLNRTQGRSIKLLIQKVVKVFPLILKGLELIILM